MALQASQKKFTCKYVDKGRTETNKIYSRHKMENETTNFINISILVFVPTCYCYTVGRVVSEGTLIIFYLILFFNIKFITKLIL